MAVGRRQPPPVPQGATPDPDRAWRLLLNLWAYVKNNHVGLPAPHGDEHLIGGSDALETPGTPTTIAAGDVGAVGVGPSFSLEDHRHGISTAIAGALANAAAEGAASSFSRSDHAHKRDVRVQAGGVDAGTRNALSFSPAFSVTDNSGSDRVDVALVGLAPVDLEFLSWVL